MIKKYELDCAVLSEVPKNPQLQVDPFFKDELIFVTRKTNNPPKKISPRELSQFDYLSYPLRFDHCYRLVEQTYGKYLRKCHVPVETINFDTLKQTLLQGIGATFMPSYLVRKELKSGALRKISISGKELPIIFSFVTKKDAVLSRATQELRAAVFRHFQ